MKKYGKCWIYKKAILNPGTPNAAIIDYSNGTNPQDLEVSIYNDGIFYDWNLANNIISIPMNVDKDNVVSIIRNGVVFLDDGSEIHWECLCGKYRNFAHYYFQNSLWFIVAIILLILLTYKCNNCRY